MGSHQPTPGAVGCLHAPDQPTRRLAAPDGHRPPCSSPKPPNHPPSDSARGFLFLPAPPKTIDVAALPKSREGHSCRKAMAALDAAEVVKGPAGPEGHALPHPWRQGSQPNLLAFPVEEKSTSRKAIRPGRMLNPAPDAFGCLEATPDGGSPHHRIRIRCGRLALEPQQQRAPPLDRAVEKADVVLPGRQEEEAPRHLLTPLGAQHPDDGLGPDRFPRLQEQRDFIAAETTGIQGHHHPRGQEPILGFPAQDIQGHHHEQEGPPPHDPNAQSGEAGNSTGGRAPAESNRAPAQGMPARIHPICHRMGSRSPLKLCETCTPPDPTMTPHSPRFAESQIRGGRPGLQLPNAAPVAPRPKSSG